MGAAFSKGDIMNRINLSGSLLISVIFAVNGCNPPAGQKGGAAKAKHDHPETGPHQGLLIELGDDEFHGEFVVDHGKKQATVYILDEKVKNPVGANALGAKLIITNVTPPLQLELKPEPQEGDSKGESSRFVATDDKLGVEMEFKGEIIVEIKGKSYTGPFEEKPHRHDAPRK
jgi:hypothetical protein